MLSNGPSLPFGAALFYVYFILMYMFVYGSAHVYVVFIQARRGRRILWSQSLGQLVVYHHIRELGPDSEPLGEENAPLTTVHLSGTRLFVSVKVCCFVARSQCFWLCCIEE